MVIIREAQNSGARIREATSGWSPITKDELILALRRLIACKVSLFLTDAKRHLLEDALVSQSSAGWWTLTDKSGLLFGFSERAINSGSVLKSLRPDGRLSAIIFRIGNWGYQLEIH